MRMAEFHHMPGLITALRVWRLQVDYRPDGWLPFSIRHKDRTGRKWWVLPIGQGCVTVGWVKRLHLTSKEEQ